MVTMIDSPTKSQRVLSSTGIDSENNEACTESSTDNIGMSGASASKETVFASVFVEAI